MADPSRVVEIIEGPTRWRFDRAFLESNWKCIWGDGCQGIHDERAPELQDGCCSVGAELIDADESRLIGALGASLDPARFEHHASAMASEYGVFSDVSRSHTALVDGACIFLNRPGFAGGAGCALHLAAVDADENPLDWKPTICWQLPLKVDRSDGHDDLRTVRAWARNDWGPGGSTMAWCCSDPTEAPEAFSADAPVHETLAAELTALVGEDVYGRLHRALSADRTAEPSGEGADARG